jgi:hypothetical protein
MSGLAGILAGHHPVGVYQWHNHLPEPEVRHAVEHAGWEYGYVDGWTHQDKHAFLEGISEGLALRDDAPSNFDAMVDRLRDLAKPTVVLWDGWGPLAREDEQAFKVALDVFVERAGENPAFGVLLRGEGPSISIPSLD